MKNKDSGEEYELVLEDGEDLIVRDRRFKYIL